LFEARAIIHRKLWLAVFAAVMAEAAFNEFVVTGPVFEPVHHVNMTTGE
jgi:hypothetical protein